MREPHRAGVEDAQGHGGGVGRPGQSNDALPGVEAATGAVERGPRRQRQHQRAEQPHLRTEQCHFLTRWSMADTLSRAPCETPHPNNPKNLAARDKTNALNSLTRATEWSVWL